MRVASCRLHHLARRARHAAARAAATPPSCAAEVEEEAALASSSTLDALRRAVSDPSRTAVVSNGRSYTYGDVLSHASVLAEQLRGALQPGATTQRLRADDGAGGVVGVASGPRVGVMASPGPEFVAALWGTWLAGGIAVPLALSHPPAELRYVFSDAGVAAVLACDEFRAALAPVAEAAGAQLLHLPPVPPSPVRGAADARCASLRSPTGPAQANASVAVPPREAGEPSRGALVIYTSGTTGRPKGALHTHGSLGAQVASLVGAWRWAASDVIVHPLPLHHIHGIVNALLCPLAVGACVEFSPKFSPAGLWARLRAGGVTVFMGVPTMYVRLLQTFDGMTTEGDRAASAAAASGLRLTVSGSAACPVPLFAAWEKATGVRLLERYGMTEVGMALSNPYDGQRRPGFVGSPLPGVCMRVVPEAGGADAAPVAGGGSDAGNGGSDDVDASGARGDAAEAFEEGPGELRLAGPQLFAGYWNRPEATAASFDADGFFATGDTVARQHGSWRILGRTSVDIIKCGGYKLSALEIEAALLEHPTIGEAAVLGIADDAYGQVVAAVLAGKGEQPPPSRAELRVWARDVLAPYKVPTLVRAVDAIPRNAMGKTNKKELAALFVDHKRG